MSIEELEKRMKIAQTALAYIKNILQKHGHEFLNEKVHLYGQTMEINTHIKDRQALVNAFFEIHWTCGIIDFYTDQKDEKALLWFVVSLKEKV